KHTEGENAAEIDRLDDAAGRDNAVAVEEAFIAAHWANFGQNPGFPELLSELFDSCSDHYGDVLVDRSNRLAQATLGRGALTC
ncbi:MAG: hypothetical protein HN409_21245, partial [Rhodospirillaceae bacterium]|nr:hypothetical protein [Rhodospirillaceae bacterium]